MAGKKIVKIKMLSISSAGALEKAEQVYRKMQVSREYLPFANGTGYKEIAEDIVVDHDGPWKHPLCMCITLHSTQAGIDNICAVAGKYLDELKTTMPLDVLSISAHIEHGYIVLITLVRPYKPGFNFLGFFNYIGEKPVDVIQPEEEQTTGSLVVPDEIRNFRYSEDVIRQHDEIEKHQEEVLQNCSKEHPFLNSLTSYEPVRLPRPEDKMDLVYDLKTADMKTPTVMPYDEFYKVFVDIMRYINGVEYYNLAQVMEGEKTEESFMDFIRNYIRTDYINKKKFIQEDLEAMMKKLYRALFQMYVLQDLIDDPNVTDIKVTAPDSIRARVKGKAYMSNINFIDVDDYKRFVNLIAIRNHIDTSVPEQTFTDTSDENYILRFSITAAYVNSVEWPYLHIRKISRKKLLGPDLIKAGMFDEKVMNYLLDCGKNSRGVVFAGPPGSGKTICLNWFLEEAYEQSAEILVIQENDELFAYRKGVMFQHVVNYSTDRQMAVSLEQLGQLALVAGANVFIIGEAKGPEICSAITLSNSGCRTAITIHSPSSTETLDKMADLAMRGYATDYNQAMRMLKSFQTVVYLQDFKVKEISEITGYDDKTNSMKYRYIYRREAS